MIGLANEGGLAKRDHENLHSFDVDGARDSLPVSRDREPLTFHDGHPHPV